MVIFDIKTAIIRKYYSACTDSWVRVKVGNKYHLLVTSAVIDTQCHR